MRNDHGLGSSTRAACFQPKSHFHEPRLLRSDECFQFDDFALRQNDGYRNVFWISATKSVWRIRLRISSRAALALTQARYRISRALPLERRLRLSGLCEGCMTLAMQSKTLRGTESPASVV